MSAESPSSSIDFGSLAHTAKFTEAVLNLNKSLDETKTILETIESLDSDKLETKDQVALDLYTSYSLSSLFWLYLRATGTDTTTVSIKNETDRVREAIARAKKVYERKSLMPRLDKSAARRFINSGLWKPGDTIEGGVKQLGPPTAQQNKKIVFDPTRMEENEFESAGPSTAKASNSKTSDSVDVVTEYSQTMNQGKKRYNYLAKEEKKNEAASSNRPTSKSKRDKTWPEKSNKFKKPY